MAIPPPPPGFRLENASPRDPWDILREEGFVATNGYRTDADTARIRAQGYAPSPTSHHNRGDGVDLNHPTMSPRQQVQRLRELFGDWEGLELIDEGHHRHLGLPGWGAAPGTPGTPNSGLPDMPEGFELEQRGSLTAGNFIDLSRAPRLPDERSTPGLLPDWRSGDLSDEIRTFLDGPPSSAPRLPQWRSNTALEDAREFLRPRASGVGIVSSSPVARPEEGDRPAGMGTVAVVPDNPEGEFVSTSSDPVALRDMLAEMNRAWWQGAPREEFYAIAERRRVPDGPWRGQLEAALSWRESNPDAASRHSPFVPAEVARIRPEDDARRTVQQAELRAHQPDLAEQTGDVFEGALRPVLGDYSAREAGNNLEDALQWTGVGDWDAAQEYQRAKYRALAEGRILDAAGNDLGAQVSTAGMIPVVGAAVGRVRRGAEALGEGARRLVRRGTPGGSAPDEMLQLIDPAVLPADPDRATNLVTPGRAIDRIDVHAVPAPPPGFTLEDPLGRVRPLGEQPSPADMADAAGSIRPNEVLPIPSNRVDDLDEARRANPGTFREVYAPRPEAVLEMRRIPHPRRPGEAINHRGPLDAEAFLRLRGGLRDDSGDLRHIGITNNAPRPEAPGDRRLGPLVGPHGMTLDEAGEALWSAGYFAERPTTDEVVEMLRASRIGQRSWHPDDLEEVAKFEGARKQRWQSEEAAQEGRPLTEDVGQPISREDLEALEPSATAYEELPRIGGRVGNINLAHIESADDIRRLLQNVEDRFGGFDAARRGKVTHAETRALASELGMTADDLLRRRRGQALNAEQALAARQLLAKSSDEVVAFAQRAVGPEASDEARTAFSEALLRHAAIHEQVTGATAEAGRALQAFRIAAQSRAVSDRIHQAAVDGMGGQLRLEDVAQGILDLQRAGVSPGGVNRFAVAAMTPRLSDKLVELWYNSLLSGPQTHVVNTLSNALTQTLQIPEHALASVLGQGRRAMRSLRGVEDDFDRVLASEVGPRMLGLMQGSVDGARAFAKTFVTGEVPDFVTKVESRSQRAISGLKGEVVRVPSRLLAAEDEFFKATARRMELNGLAVRRARSEGLRGQALRNRIAELAANPTDEMLEMAMDTARYLTFQRPLQGLPADISRFTQRQPWMKLFLPFIRTPTNIFKYAVERSPFAPVLREVRQNLAAGGARRHLAVAKMMLGTGLGMAIAQLASDGVITGSGPEDRREREMLLADGWQPYSVRIGDTYYSYQRLDPLAMTLGTAANLAGVWSSAGEGDLERMGAHLISSVIGNLSDKTWLSSFGDLMGAVNDPKRYLGDFVSRIAGSIAVPTGVAQVTRWMDPTLREARDPLSRIQSRIPGLSDNLPARRDVWGQPIVSGGGLGPDLVSPIWTNEARNDPAVAELSSIGVSIGRPARKIRGQELSPDQFATYHELSGRYIREEVMEALSDAAWAESTVPERRRWVQSIIRDARADAREDLGLYVSDDDEEEGAPTAPPPVPAPPPGFVVEN